MVLNKGKAGKQWTVNVKTCTSLLDMSKLL